MTRVARASASGSCSATHASLLIVNEATGTLHVSAAHCCVPSSSTNRSACGADVVSFHSLAGRTGVPSTSSSTSPCCWPATEMATTSLR